MPEFIIDAAVIFLIIVLGIPYLILIACWLIVEYYSLAVITGIKEFFISFATAWRDIWSESDEDKQARYSKKQEVWRAENLAKEIRK